MKLFVEKADPSSHYTPDLLVRSQSKSPQIEPSLALKTSHHIGAAAFDSAFGGLTSEEVYCGDVTKITTDFWI